MKSRFFYHFRCSSLVKLLCITAAIVGFCSGNVFSEPERGFTLKEDLSELQVEIGLQYAVIIGINNYQSWLPLQNPVKDARELKEILQTKYYLNTIYELYNEKATKANIIKLLDYLKNTLTSKDSLLIFFAGHGYFDGTTQSGYWIPVDGDRDPVKQSNWISNNIITQYIAGMNTRHVLLIADSCFSGTLIQQSRGPVPTIDNDYFKKAYSRIARQVITSGELEAVPDSSEFAYQLKMALLKSTQPCIDAIMLYDDIRLGVTKTMPSYGSLKETGHQEGASFLLFQKDEKTAGTQPANENMTILPWEELDKQPFGTMKSYFSLSLTAGLTLPMPPVSASVKNGLKATISADYNWVYPWGSFGLGLTTGFQSEECSADLSYFDQFFPGISTAATGQLVSIPIGLHAECHLGITQSIFAFVELTAGGTFSMISSKTLFSLNFLPAAGLGFYFTEQSGIAISVAYNVILLADIPYNGIVIGVKGAIKL
jgi:hypothetical protein